MPLLLSLQETIEHALKHTDVMDLNWLPAATSLVVFLVAFGFLYMKVWPKIVQGLEDRENKIRREIESAEQAREQAKAALAEYERSLASAREEANAMIVKAKADAKAAGEQLRAHNEAHLVEMKLRATRDIDSAKAAAIGELHTQATMLAADIAAKILSRELTAQDQQRLINESLDELGAASRT